MTEVQLQLRRDVPSYQQNLLRKINDTNANYEQYAQEMSQSPYNQYFLNDLEEQKKMRRQYPLGQGFRALYPGLLNYDLPDVYSILVNPQQISPLLGSLVKENQILKEELQIACDDIAKFMSMNDTVIDENRNVVAHLYSKDIDVQKLIESVTLNEQEEIMDLNHQIQLFREENNILIKHVHDSKKKEEDSTQVKYRQKVQLQNAQDLYERINFDFTQSKSREEEQSKEIILLRLNLEQLTDSTAQKVGYIADADKQISFYQSEDAMHIEKINQLERELEDSNQEKNNKIIQQSQFIYNLQMNQDQQKQQLEYRLNKERIQLGQDNNQVRILNEQIAEEADYYKSQFEQEKSRSEQMKIKENELIISHSQIKDELEKLEFFNKEMKRELSMHQIQSEEDILEREKKFDRHFNNVKAKFSQNMKEKEDAIIEYEVKVHEMNLQIEQLNHDLQLKVNEITALNQKLLDYLQLKKIIDQQQFDIRQYNDIIVTAKQDAQDLEVVNSKLEDEFKNQIDKLEKDIYNLENIIDSQKTKIESQHQVIEHHQKIKHDREQLEIKIHHLQEENNRLTQEIRRNQEDQEIYHTEKELITREGTNVRSQLGQTKRLQDQIKELIDENQTLRQDLNAHEREVKRLKLLLDNKDQIERQLKERSRRGSESPINRPQERNVRFEDQQQEKRKPVSYYEEQDKRIPSRQEVGQQDKRKTLSYGQEQQSPQQKRQNTQSPPIREARRGDFIIQSSPKRAVQIEDPLPTFANRQLERDRKQKQELKQKQQDYQQQQAQQQQQQLLQQQQRQQQLQQTQQSRSPVQQQAGQTLQKQSKETPPFSNFGQTKPSFNYQNQPYSRGFSNDPYKKNA